VISYLRDPKAIYARSFEIIRAEADFSKLPKEAHTIATRVIHSCGMPEIAADLRITADFLKAANRAIQNGLPIFVDAEMVHHGIIDKSLNVVCTLNDPKTRGLAASRGTTRSAAAVDLWVPKLKGSIVVIGNAPTALFALLELIDNGAGKPAAIVGMPVGFVGAVESKSELVADPRDIPYATLLGRRGGSAMAAAVINAMTRDETA
jgi:precorrin-8X/cobalt-precorrin-8 methylmutase